MNNCRENMESLYKYITINIAIHIVYPTFLSKNETSSSTGITSPSAKSKKNNDIYSSQGSTKHCF